MRAPRAPVVLAALALARTAAAAPPPIVGGTPATQGEYPNVVGIVIDTGETTSLCTGTLIAPGWVLTAAHCVEPAELGVTTQAAVTAAISVYVGTLDVLDGQTQGVGAQLSVYDPAFVSLGSHDAGLIQLTTPTTGIAPVQLNYFGSDAPIGIAVEEVGYGETSGTGSGVAGELYQVQQTSVDCSIGGVGENADLLCFDQTDGKGQCVGDSGGPAFAQIEGKPIEVGITSFSDTNCAQFGAATRTDAEASWILQYLPELECSADADCLDDRVCTAHQCVAPTTSSGGGCDAGGGGASALLGAALCLLSRGASRRRSDRRASRARACRTAACRACG